MWKIRFVWEGMFMTLMEKFVIEKRSGTVQPVIGKLDKVLDSALP